MSEDIVTASASASQTPGIQWGQVQNLSIKARMILPGGLQVLGWEPAPAYLNSRAEGVMVCSYEEDKPDPSATWGSIPNPTLGHLVVQTSDGERGRVKVERLKE